MVRYSFTLDVIPSTYGDNMASLVVKMIPLDGGKWGEVTRLLDTEVPIDLNDIPERDIPWTAVVALQQGLRVFSARVADREAERK